jgi:hypothetical protein
MVIFFSLCLFFDAKRKPVHKVNVLFSLTFNVNWFLSQHICYLISYYLPLEAKSFSWTSDNRRLMQYIVLISQGSMLEVFR